MNTLSRRRFCLLAGTAPLALPLTAHAQADPSPAAPLYDEATNLLRRGRNFQNAIDLLTRAVTIEPTNSEYFLALGCAAASRFAALAWAAYATDALAKERADYIDRMRDWQAERARLQVETPQEFDAAAYDRYRPVEPPARIFPTKDDNRPYRLTLAQRDAQLTGLARAARAAWEKGLALAVTPAQKAEAYYVRGWGRRVLQTFDIIVFKVDTLPSATPEIRADFAQATTLAPDNSVYWQALADAWGDDKAALPAYEKAAILADRSANLWYRLYTQTVRGGEDVTPEMWRAAQTYLHNAQRFDRANAYPCFEEAGILFQYAPYALTGPSGPRNLTPDQKEVYRTPVRNATARKNGRRAIDLLLRGSGLPRCVVPMYADSAPSLLSAAWQYTYHGNNADNMWARLRELARGGIGYGRFMAEFDNSPDEGIRACRAVITMGKRLTGDWSLPENGRSGEGRTIVYVGNMVSTVGYRTLLQVYVIINDTIAANAVQAEYDGLQKRYAEFRAAENAKFGTGVASYY